MTVNKDILFEKANRCGIVTLNRPKAVNALTYDMHANVSARMVELATIVNKYMTNPHLDPRLRARQSLGHQ